jgi:hypothetical protein
MEGYAVAEGTAFGDGTFDFESLETKEFNCMNQMIDLCIFWKRKAAFQ